jgi:hypothetical protein
MEDSQDLYLIASQSLKYHSYRDEVLNNSDLKALKEIFLKTKIIEGPYYIIGFKSTKYETEILLLGDIHSDTEFSKCKDKFKIDCTPEQSCYSLYSPISFAKLLDEMTKKYKSAFFIETWQEIDDIDTPVDESAFLGFKNPSAHKDLIKELTTCFNQRGNNKDNCPVQKLEVHMADVRATKDLTYKKYQAESLFRLFLRCVADLKDDRLYSTFKDICYSYFPEIEYIEILKTLRQGLFGDYVNMFWTSDLFKKYSRTMKQILKCDQTVQNELKENFPYHTDTSPRITEETYPEFIIIKDILDGLIKKINEIFLIKDLQTILRKLIRRQNIVYLTSLMRCWNKNWLLDLYFISRSLRPQFNFDLAVGFFGGNHIEQISSFLSNSLDFKKVFDYGLQYSKEELNIKNINIDKCIPLV